MNFDTILQILQTTGICVSAVALTVIAFIVFSMWFTFIPESVLEESESDLSTEKESEDGEKADSSRKRGRRRR
jgi:hypothetical protein